MKRWETGIVTGLALGALAAALGAAEAPEALAERVGADAAAPVVGGAPALARRLVKQELVGVVSDTRRRARAEWIAPVLVQIEHVEAAKPLHEAAARQRDVRFQRKLESWATQLDRIGEYGDQVAVHFHNSMHLVAPGQGHIATTRGCMGRLVSEFVIAGGSEDLDTSCMSQMQASPFFLSLTGPTP